ncbi:MAG: YtxH domain-containing protein, partial [Clostridiaceae bacterium]|nr:YtxH domain-containing protein [Clostridiaceae bacterium]
ILVGTAAGSLSGLLGGLLFSPKSGKENRETIVNTSKDITNNVKEKSIELKEAIDNKVSDTKDNVIDAKDKIKQKSSHLKENLDNKVSGVKENATDAKVKISEYLNEKRGTKVVSETNDVVAAKDSEDVVDLDVQTDLTEKKAKK